MDTVAIKEEMLAEAATSAKDFVREWTEKTGGNQYGEPMYCGFAWVTIYPEFAHKGNTRPGRAERKEFESRMSDMGFRKDWTGKAYEMWNPSQWGGQSMDVKEAGARAAAKVLSRYGFKAYAGSRAD